MSGEFVPVIDLESAGGTAELAAAVDDACRRSGFFVITGHGVPQETVQAAYQAFRVFFRGPEDTKQSVAADLDDDLLKGYIPGERQEQYYVNRLGESPFTDPGPRVDPRLTSPNRWPATHGFRTEVMAYYEAIEQVGTRLLDVFSAALGVDQQKMRTLFANHMSPMVCNYYAPQPATPPEGSLRTAQHRDWCAFTVLYQDTAPGGLQVMAGESDWVNVPYRPGSFVVNIGRIMSTWTAGRWASTVHRVVNPSRADAHRDRISMAYFFHPNPDLALRPLNELGVPAGADLETAGDYHIARTRSARERQRFPAQRGALICDGVPAEFEVGAR